MMEMQTLQCTKSTWIVQCKGVWEKGILTSESQIRKRDFILRHSLAQVQESGHCQVHTSGPNMAELGEDSTLTHKTHFFITSFDWQIDRELDLHLRDWPSLNKTKETAIQQQ